MQISKSEEEYHEYLMEQLRHQCRLCAIEEPIWLHSISANADRSTTFRVGNDPPGPSIDVTYRVGDLLPPPPKY